MPRERPPIEELRHAAELRIAASHAAILEIERSGALAVIVKVEAAVYCCTDEQDLIRMLYAICSQFD